MKSAILTSVVLFSILSVKAQSSSGAEQEIKKLSNDWMIAAMKRDEKALNKIVAPEYKLGGTNFDNPVIGREMWMKYTMENLTIDSMNYTKMKVEVIDNVAIVQSEFFWSVAFDALPAKKDTVNLVDTWIKRNQAWQVVSRIVVDK